MQESGLQTPLMASVLGGNVFAVKDSFQKLFLAKYDYEIIL